MISRIEAQNYRCFPKLAIDLDRCHVLVGAHGAGKSTLLDVPVLIGDMLRRQALDQLRRPHEVRVFDADLGKPARPISAKNCHEPAFIQLREQLRALFPEH
jgi:predicted ATP-binding protein involved in virulence